MGARNFPDSPKPGLRHQNGAAKVQLGFNRPPNFDFCPLRVIDTSTLTMGLTIQTLLVWLGRTKTQEYRQDEIVSWSSPATFKSLHSQAHHLSHCHLTHAWARNPMQSTTRMNEPMHRSRHHCQGQWPPHIACCMKRSCWPLKDLLPCKKLSLQPKAHQMQLSKSSSCSASFLAAAWWQRL